jgi:ribose 5-phosphate isomerase A
VTQDQAKEAAAQAAASLVLDGMIVGLGTGTTAKFAVDALAQRIRQGLRFTGVPTSETTALQARSLGIPLKELDGPIDLTIDGADEIDPRTLNLIKGRGGALLREKIVAASSKQLIIIADESKLVDQLGSKMPVPVEVIPFGWCSTAERLEALGCKAILREGYVTDSGHSILDCTFGAIRDPQSLAQQLDATVGVVEHGLFLNLATQAIIASNVGQPLWLQRPPRPPTA